MNTHQIKRDSQLIQQSITDFLDMLVANPKPTEKELERAIREVEGLCAILARDMRRMEMRHSRKPMGKSSGADGAMSIRRAR